VRVLVVMLRRLSAQTHDYNLKLTKAELIELDEFGPAWRKLTDLIEKEAKRLGGGE
jgi:hypothetical protein